MNDVARGIGQGLIVVLLVLIGFVLGARAEEPHDHSQMGAAGEFYAKWMRPGGAHAGIRHRQSSCCNRTDCSPVIAFETRDGQLYARFELEPTVWFQVPRQIIESNQPDPLESPDDRAHGCVIGGQVVCLVFGAGI